MVPSVMPCVINTWPNTINLFFLLLCSCIWKVLNYNIWCWPFISSISFITRWALSVSNSNPWVLEIFWIIFFTLIFASFLFFLSGALTIYWIPCIDVLLFVSPSPYFHHFPLHFLRDSLNFMHIFLIFYFSHPIFNEFLKF